MQLIIYVLHATLVIIVQEVMRELIQDKQLVMVVLGHLQVLAVIWVVCLLYVVMAIGVAMVSELHVQLEHG